MPRRRHQPITSVRTCSVCGTLCVSAPSLRDVVNLADLLDPAGHVCRACTAERSRLSAVDTHLSRRAPTGSHHLHAPLAVWGELERRGLLEEPCVPAAPTDAACPVCQEDVDPALDGVPATRACGHLLHRVCYARLRPRLTGGVECPLCRTPITRHDLPFDARPSAVLHAHRLVCALLEQRGAAAADVRAHHALLYNVCTRALCNALLHRRLKGDPWVAASERELASHNRFAETVAALNEDEG